MKNRILIVLFCFLFAINFSGCRQDMIKKSSAPIKRVAVVSLTVNDWGGSVTSGSVGSRSVYDLINGALLNLVKTTEGKLSQVMQVKKVSEFINDSNYRNLGVENKHSVRLPAVNGKQMVVFSQEGSEIKGGVLTPQVAQKLCSALKVDGVVLIYSEWTAQVGHFVPTTKALTKNVVTVWDRSGNMVFKKRVDEMGSRTIGVGGFKAVNDSTIQQWSEAYGKAFDQISKEMKQLTTM